MNDTLAANAICPFFNTHSKYSISCANEENNEYEISLKFSTNACKKVYAIKNCCKFTYHTCEIFKILMR